MTDTEPKTIPVVAMPAEVMRAAAVYTNKTDDRPTLHNVWTLPARDVNGGIAVATDSHGLAIAYHYGIHSSRPDPQIDYKAWLEWVEQYTDKVDEMKQVPATEVATQRKIGTQNYRLAYKPKPPPRITPLFPQSVSPASPLWGVGYLAAFDLVAGAFRGRATKAPRDRDERHQTDSVVAYLGSGDGEVLKPGIWIVRSALGWEAVVLLMPVRAFGA